MSQRVCGKVLQQDARLNAHDQIVHVVLQDLVHPLRAEHQAARKRNASADKACARTSAGDRNLVCRADFHDFGDLFRGLHVHSRLRHIFAVNRHLIV